MDGPKYTITVPVPVPREVEERALEKAIQAGELDRFEEYLLDSLRFDYDFQLSDELERAEFLRSTV